MLSWRGGKGLVSRPGVLSEEVLLEVAASISPGTAAALRALCEMSVLSTFLQPGHLYTRREGVSLGAEGSTLE